MRRIWCPKLMGCFHLPTKAFLITPFRDVIGNVKGNALWRWNLRRPMNIWHLTWNEFNWLDISRIGTLQEEGWRVGGGHGAFPFFLCGFHAYSGVIYNSSSDRYRQGGFLQWFGKGFWRWLTIRAEERGQARIPPASTSIKSIQNFQHRNI